MKYLKTYEKIIKYNKYNIDDYVYVKFSTHLLYIFELPKNDKHLILKVYQPAYNPLTDSVIYRVVSYTGIEGIVNEKDILRKATIEEIEEYKTLESSKKYNI